MPTRPTSKQKLAAPIKHVGPATAAVVGGTLALATFLQARRGKKGKSQYETRDAGEIAKAEAMGSPTKARIRKELGRTSKWAGDHPVAAALLAGSLGATGAYGAHRFARLDRFAKVASSEPEEGNSMSANTIRERLGLLEPEAAVDSEEGAEQQKEAGLRTWAAGKLVGTTSRKASGWGAKHLAGKAGGRFSAATDKLLASETKITGLGAEVARLKKLGPAGEAKAAKLQAKLDKHVGKVDARMGKGYEHVRTARLGHEGDTAVGAIGAQRQAAMKEYKRVTGRDYVPKGGPISTPPPAGGGGTPPAGGGGGGGGTPPAGGGTPPAGKGLTPGAALAIGGTAVGAGVVASGNTHRKPPQRGINVKIGAAEEALFRGWYTQGSAWDSDHQVPASTIDGHDAFSE